MRYLCFIQIYIIKHISFKLTIIVKLIVVIIIKKYNESNQQLV